MDVAMLSHSISNILQCTSSLKPLPSRLSGIDIHNLENNLKQINDQLENNHKQIHANVQKHSPFSEWLQEVKDVVIDLNDLMEDLRYKESITDSSKTLIKMGLNIINRHQFKKAILQVNKASEELELLLNEVKKFRNEEEAVISYTDEKRKSAYKDFEKSTEHVAVGREREKKKIIDQLLKINKADAAVPAVIAIVGVPGIGKTKLARLVCEDEQVKGNSGFQPIWITKLARLVCGNSGFQPIWITKLARLVCEDEQVKGNSGFQPIWINGLHHRFDVESIVKCVSDQSDHEKRVLLVIDDLRIEIKNDDLKKLQKKLMKAAGGRTVTAILVTTTRSNHVANDIAARHVLKLQELNQEESWSLFQQIHGPITSAKKEQSTIEPEHEREIVEGCGGVPLLIVIEATLMMKQSGGGGDKWITEALEMLKCIYYDNLPTYQKLCFAYCSLFPEDYLFDAERLIQLWTAEGFLINPEQQFGQACFEDFVPLVFHQAKEESDHHQYCGVVRNNMNNYLYRMNRLMHKLATQEITGNENITVDVMGEGVQDGMLRVSFDFALDLSSEIPDLVFQKAKKLRTILLPYNINNPRLPHEVKVTTSTCDKIFDTFKWSLRVLDLHNLGIETVPSSIEDVKYLRYLDLSQNNIEKLPSCITNLIHLQTLKLSQCHVLKELPKDMDDLSCLNHLDLEGCLDLTQMPSGINKLTSLQTLSLFVASKKQVTGGLRSLTDLNNLRGHLEISHLEEVKFSPSKEAAKDDFLKNKQHLEFLTLRWDHEEDEEEKEKNEEDEEEKEKNEKEKEINTNDKKLLNCLVPPPNLRVLFVVGYNGHTLSNWLDSLQCLVKFTLNDCPKCKFLPPMDKLPHLKVLQLRRLDSLQFIAKNNEVGNSPSSSTPIFFPSLKELTISDCPDLEGWWKKKIPVEDRPYFPCISKLNVQYCPKLECMPLYPGLDEELVLVEFKARSIWDTIRHVAKKESTSTSESFLPLSKLKSMVIERINYYPPKSWFKNSMSLQKLHLRDCFRWKYLPEDFWSLSSLQTLTIERCQELDLDKYPNEWEGLKNLHSLTLRSIPKLKSLPVENVNTLKYLRIYDCHGITSLPESIGNLTSLERLVLSECRCLDSLPKGMEKLRSLHTLVIIDCPLLLPRCQPDTGDDWPQIAHIKNKLVKETPQDLMDHL